MGCRECVRLRLFWCIFLFRASCPHVAQEARPWVDWEGRPGLFRQGSCAVRVIQSCFRGIEYQFGSNKDTDNQPSSYTLSNKPNDQQGSKARKRKETSKHALKQVHTHTNRQSNKYSLARPRKCCVHWTRCCYGQTTVLCQASGICINCDHSTCLYDAHRE